MAAGERLFIDLLPDSWTGVPPGLPKEVIEDLARRAREAERNLRAQRQLTGEDTEAGARAQSPVSRPSRATCSNCRM